jgi:hypothetical protein
MGIPSKKRKKWGLNWKIVKPGIENGGWNLKGEKPLENDYVRSEIELKTQRI